MTIATPQTVFTGFRIATMDPEISTPYGAVEGSAIGIADGRILWIVPRESLPEFDSDVEFVEGTGHWISPGLIDCHTHLVYGGNRAAEWEMRLTGVSYEEIARNGGGILSSVRHTRNETMGQLVQSARNRLRQLMNEGVTTIEIKSGYGLDLETELKMLSAAQAVADQSGVHVEATMLAAHAVPPEYKDRPDAYVDLVCNEMIPAAADLCTCVDAFCESIAFSVDQTKRVFEAALEAGLNIKVHAEQLTHTGIAAIAAEMGAISADHLEFLKPADCPVMAANGTVATLLPGAFYCLKETRRPPVEAMYEYGVDVALATDCNPGSSPVTSLLLMGNMGCNFFGLTPEQAFAGITRNAAKALALQDDVGMIRKGMRADLVVWDVEVPAEMLYGVGHNPCLAVYRNGQVASPFSGPEFE